MPCADAEPIVSYNKVTINNQSNQHHNNDACSPLCICNCCGSQGFSYNIMYSCNIFSVKTIIDKKTPVYKSILTSNLFSSIWQPPQIKASFFFDY